jgi:hydrogenase maturation protease
VGARDRGDDGVGPLVADEIRVSHPDVDVRECRDSFDLLDAVADANTVVVVDAARVVGDGAGSPPVPGTIHIAADLDQAQPSLGLSSTHGFGPSEVLALAGTLGGAQATVTLVAVVGERFDTGADVSDAVTAAVPAAAEQAVRLLGQGSDPLGEH